MQKLAWIILLALRSFEGMGVRAAIQTSATCANTFAWSFNSMNQSPCLVSAYLLGACTGGEWTVPALPTTAGGSPIGYSPPTLDTRSLCSCSWAVYNLLSACDACQGGSWITWPTWEFNCTVSGNMVSSEAFPPSISIPPETVIPQWAAKDPTTWTGSFFNTTEAQSVGSQDYVPSTSGSASQTGSATSSSSSTPTAGSSNGPPVGPIVGGVVGGLLGILLIVVLAIWLLCPSVFRRRRIATTDIGYPSKKDLQPSVSSTPIHIPGGAAQYDTATVSTSRQQLVAPGASRPPLHQQFTSSTYSVGTSVDHTTTSAIPLQNILPMAPTPPHLNGAVNISPPPTSTGSTYTPPLPEGTASDTTSSIRTFFTRASHRQGHSHTPSDTSITSSSTLLPRIQQGLWRQQQRPGDEVVPYILPSSIGDASTSGSTGTASPPLHGYPVDRKQRITGLQYTPPPPATPEENSDIATMGFTPATVVNGAPSVIAGMTDVYGALGSSLVDGEIDRRTNMSPANASSILEAAPPYVTDDRHEVAGRRHAPRLADVQEYPDEKSRFMNAEREL